jgi:hypothetical protein
MLTYSGSFAAAVEGLLRPALVLAALLVETRACRERYARSSLERAQHRHNRRRRGALRLIAHRAVVVELPLHADRIGGEVDVGPGQAEHLADPQSDVGADQRDGPERRAFLAVR